MYVSPETFALHAAILTELFTVLPLHEIVTRLRDGRVLPKGACAITFDDGWLDNLEHALPVLEANGLPATIFVVTGRVGTSGAFWPDEMSRRLTALDAAARHGLAEGLGWPDGEGSIHALLSGLKDLSEVDRIPALEAIRQSTVDPMAATRELLAWDELTTLASRGVDIEAHGVSHAILTRTTREEARRELQESLGVLRDRGHGRHALFAYPSGGFDAEIVRLAREVGYVGAVTTELGLATGACDPLRLPRLALHDDVTSTRREFLRWVPGAEGRS